MQVIYILLAFIGSASTVLACNMHNWKMPAAAKEPIHVQGADIPIPDDIDG